MFSALRRQQPVLAFVGAIVGAAVISLSPVLSSAAPESVAADPTKQTTDRAAPDDQGSAADASTDKNVSSGDASTQPDAGSDSGGEWEEEKTDPYSKVALTGDVALWSQNSDELKKTFGGGIQWSSRWVQGAITIKSAAPDAITGNANHAYGDFLLFPSAATLAAAVDFAWWRGERTRGLFRVQSGYVFALHSGMSKWQPDGLPERTVVGTALNVGYGIRLGARECEFALQCWSVQLGGGFSGRALMGDGGQSRTFRDAAIGPHAGRVWAGAFGSARVTVAYVSIGMDLYLLGGNSLQGLTGGQLVPNIVAVVPLELPLKSGGAANPDEASQQRASGQVTAFSTR